MNEEGENKIHMQSSSLNTCERERREKKELDRHFQHKKNKIMMLQKKS